MTDQELLEMAAKAADLTHAGYSGCACGDYYHPRDGEAGLVVDSDVRHKSPLCDDSGAWNPLNNDGDALRLAVALRLQITPGTYNTEEATAYRAGTGEASERVHYQQDISAATRRAIVRAAARLGKAMP